MSATKASLALTAAVLGGLLLWAGLRERTGAAGPPRPLQPEPAKAVQKSSAPQEEKPADTFDRVAREVAADLRRLQERRQREWAMDVDRQTRLEWMERYDAERKALLDRLEPHLAGRPRSVLDGFDTWAAAQKEYGKP